MGGVSMNVILMGPQGAGKGTQTARVASRFKLAPVATGELFREAIGQGTILGEQIRGLYDRGELVPDDLTIGLVAQKLDAIARKRERGEAAGAIFDGFPRTFEQAKSLDELLGKRGNAVTAVIRIDVPFESLVTRLAGRRVCQRCGAVYHVEFNPPRRDGLCDRCEGEVVQRADDTPEAVTNRLRLYFDLTAPLLAYYDGRGLVTGVNGDQAIDVVTEEIAFVIEHASQIELNVSVKKS